MCPLDCIDIDYLCRKKDSKKTTQLLQLLDGTNKDASRVCIFTTNETLDSIDSALLRPGRIDKIIHFPNPNSKLRSDFIHSWPKEIKTYISDNSNLIDQTHGFSFAQLAEIKQQIGIRYIDKSSVNLQDILNDVKNKNGISISKVGF